MSEERVSEAAEPEFGTQPTPHHEWLSQLVGNWQTVTQIIMGPEETMTASGSETVTSFGGLFAWTQGHFGTAPAQMEYKSAIGYDVTFDEYRAVTVMNRSSHIWNYKGTLSEDGRKLTLVCEGPNLDPNADENSPQTAIYHVVHELESNARRTARTYAQLSDGELLLVSHVQFERTAE